MLDDGGEDAAAGVNQMHADEVASEQRQRKEHRKPYADLGPPPSPQNCIGMWIAAKGTAVRREPTMRPWRAISRD